MTLPPTNRQDLHDTIHTQGPDYPKAVTKLWNNTKKQRANINHLLKTRNPELKNWAEEIPAETAVAWLERLNYLHDNPQQLDNIRNFDGYIYAYARTRLHYYKEHLNTPASGMTNITRRATTIRAAIAQHQQQHPTQKPDTKKIVKNLPKTRGGQPTINDLAALNPTKQLHQNIPTPQEQPIHQTLQTTTTINPHHTIILHLLHTGHTWTEALKKTGTKNTTQNKKAIQQTWQQATNT